MIQSRLRSHLLSKASTDSTGGHGNAHQGGSAPPSSQVPASAGGTGGAGGASGVDDIKAAGQAGQGRRPSISKATVQMQVGAVHCIVGGWVAMPPTGQCTYNFPVSVSVSVSTSPSLQQKRCLLCSKFWIRGVTSKIRIHSLRLSSCCKKRKNGAPGKRGYIWCCLFQNEPSRRKYAQEKAETT